MYIGYSLAGKWLIDSSGYEYHATRLPFIWFLKLCLVQTWIDPRILFNILYAMILLAIVLILNKYFTISPLAGFIAFPLFLLNPIYLSLSSWSIPNGFATLLATFCVAIILWKKPFKFQSLIIALLITASLIMNILISFIIIFPLLFLKRTRIKIVNVKQIFSIFLVASLWELTWKISMGFTVGSLWKTYFEGVLTFNSSLSSDWKSLDLLSGESALLVSALFLTIWLKIYNILKRNESEIINYLLAFWIILFITYILRINAIGFFWYFYQIFPIIVFLLYTILKDLAKYPQVFVTSLLMILQIILLIFFNELDFARNSLQNAIRDWHITYEKPLLVALIFFGIGFMIWAGTKVSNSSFVIHFKSISIIKQTKISVALYVICILSLFGVKGYAVNFKAPPSIGLTLINDQKVYMSELAKLPSKRNYVATWAEPDESGWTGSLLSTSNFHLMRLEGKGIGKDIPNPQDWINRHGKLLPRYIILITKFQNVEQDNRLTPDGYSILKKVLLPSEKSRIIIIKRMGVLHQ